MVESARGPLQEFLADCARDGVIDSSGEFTLDSALARRKLARYHVADPDAFLVQWVRFAVLCDATKTSIEQHGKELVLIHDGHWPAVEEVSNLYGRERSATRALAYCLWSGLRYRFKQATYNTPEGLVHFQEKGEELREKTGPGKEARFCLMLTPKAIKGELLGREQREMLESRCAYAPLEITFLNQKIPTSAPYACVMHGLLSPQSVTRWPVCDPPGGDIPAGQRMRWPRANTEFNHKQTTRETYRAAFFIGVQNAPEALHVVVDGICHEMNLPWRLPRLLVVVSSPRLKLDLTGDRIARNEDYQAVMGELVGDLDRLFRQAVTDIDDAPAGLVPYLEALISVRLRSKDYKSAYEICRWVFLKGMGPRVRKDFSTWQRASFLYRFSLVSRLMNDPHSARDSLAKAELEWAKAPQKDTRWLPHADESPAELTAAERILLCRMAVDVQTLEDGPEGIRTPLMELIGKLENRRWGAAVYCLRWLVELDSGIYPIGHRRLANDLGRLGVALVRANQAKTPHIERWREARSVLAAAMQGWGRLVPASTAAPAPEGPKVPKSWSADAAIFAASAPKRPVRRPLESDMGFLITLLELQIVVDGHLGDTQSAQEKMQIWMAQMDRMDPEEVGTRARRFKVDLRGADTACLALLEEKMRGVPGAKGGPRIPFLSYFRSSLPVDEIPPDED